MKSASLTSAGCAGLFEMTQPSGRFHRCTSLCPRLTSAGSARSLSVRCRFHTWRPVYRGLLRIVVTVPSVHPVPGRCGLRPGSAADGHGIPASFSARAIRATECPTRRWAKIHRTTCAVSGSGSSQWARRPQAAWALFGCGPASPRRYPYGGRLAAILNKDHQGRNPTLRDFAKRAGVESLFRSFSPQSTLQEVAVVRQELYLRLCEQIWDPARLRISNRTSEMAPARPLSAASGEERMPSPVAPRPKRKILQSHVGKLVRAGALQPGEKIVGTHKGTDYWASIEDDGAIVLSVTGARYTRIDEAAKEVRQKGGAWSSGTRKAQEAHGSPSANCSLPSPKPRPPVLPCAL
jgi:hypothetical protein